MGYRKEFKWGWIKNKKVIKNNYFKLINMFL